MHELIGALVYSDDMKQALREASRVFSKHTGIDVQDEQGLHSSRFDYFVLLDPQAAVDFAEFRKNVLETMRARAAWAVVDEVPGVAPRALHQG